MDPVEIHDALGGDAATVRPPLLLLRAMTIRLPEYLVRALETAAARAQQRSMWLHQELIGFAGTVVDRMEAIAPGFRRAYFYPCQG